MHSTIGRARRAACLWALTGLAAACPGLAMADQNIYPGVTSQEMMSFITQAGHTGTIQTGSDGLDYIDAEGGGFYYGVNFYACEGTPPRCKQIQLKARFTDAGPQELGRIEAFEREFVFGRSYVQDGEAVIDHALHINGGATGDQMVNNLLLYENVLSGFRDYLYGTEPETGSGGGGSGPKPTVTPGPKSTPSSLGSSVPPMTP